MIWKLFVAILISSCSLASFSDRAIAGGEAEHAAGIVEYKRRSYRAALRQFEESLAKGNGSGENYLYIAHCHAASGNPKDAVRVYRDIVRIFKGLPVAAAAEQYANKLDPQKRWRETEQPAPAAKRSFVNRITIIAPTVAGHPPVSPSTVGIVRKAISDLPTFLYKILDEGGATVNIGPNIIDKWPDAMHFSKPGEERKTLARDGARTYDHDIYVWERLTNIGSTELLPPIEPAELRNEMLYQLGHALDDIIVITKNPEYLAEYERDKARLSSDDQRILKYYLNPVNNAGAGEVCAAMICSFLRGQSREEVRNSFPNSATWIRRKLDALASGSGNSTQTASRATSTTRVVAVAGSKTAVANSRNTVAQPKTSTGTTAGSIASTASTTNSKSAVVPIAEEIPKDERVPYERSFGDKLFVNGTINGKPVKCLIDTGAFKNVIGKDQLLKLGIAPPTGPTTLIGHGAAGALHGWEAEYNITVGGIKRHQAFHVIEKEPYVILGQTFLSGIHYRINRTAGYLQFTKEIASMQKHTSDATELPFRMVDNSLIVVATINGTNLEMNFDTGAPMCVFSLGDGARYGLRPEPGQKPIAHGGVGTGVALGYMVTAPRIDVGSNRQFNVSTLLTETPMSYPVLGQSFFGQMHFIIDNEKKVIRFTQ